MIMNLIEQIKKHEGFRGQPYLCSAGATTIGYGRNLDANPLTQEEAEVLLSNDVINVMAEVKRHVNLQGHCEARKAVIINMAFNLGVPRLLKFKNMLAAFDKHDYEVAAIEMIDSKWARQVGQRAMELAQQMRTGDWG